MHWSEAYIGQPYIPNEADCARLLCRVRKEVFQKEIPQEADLERAAGRLGRVAQMRDAVNLLGIRTENPQEGDAVLMICRSRPSHIGAYCVVRGEPSVLHAMENAKQVVLHRLRDLDRVNLSVEGFYAWK